MASKKKIKKNVKVKPKAKPAKKKAVKKKNIAKKLVKKPVLKKKSKKVVKKASKKIIKKTAKKLVKKSSVKKILKPVKVAKPIKPTKPVKPVVKKLDIPVVQKVKKCKKSLCKEPAVINGYCRYHYIAGWKVENIDKKVKKVKHLEKLVIEIKKRFPHEYMELIKADLVSDKIFKQVLKDMDLEEDINNFEVSDDTQRIIESYSSLVDLEREE